jgi:hypothetical protein
MIRRDPIYVSTEVWRWLRLLAKAEPAPENANTSYDTISRKVTPDEIADQILRQAIREQHPQLAELQKELDAMEKRTVQALIDQREGKKHE